VSCDPRSFSRCRQGHGWACGQIRDQDHPYCGAVTLSGAGSSGCGAGVFNNTWVGGRSGRGAKDWAPILAYVTGSVAGPPTIASQAGIAALGRA
jgi:hypothetical protein